MRTSGSGDITVLLPSNLVTIQAVNQSPGGRAIFDFPQVRVVEDETRRAAPNGGRRAKWRRAAAAAYRVEGNHIPSARIG